LGDRSTTIATIFSSIHRVLEWKLLFPYYLAQGNNWLGRKSYYGVDQRTRQIMDFEVASTIYYPARPSQGHMWHLYAP
jgi:hypothetical protein